MPRNDPQLKGSKFIVLASVCITVAALYFAQDVLVPLALAILLSFLLAPLVRRLERSRLHRAVAVGIIMTLAIAIVGALTWIVVLQVRDLAEQLPSYRSNIVSKITQIRGSSNGGLIGSATRAIAEVKHAVSDSSTQPATGPAVQSSGTAVQTTAAPATPLEAPTTQPVPVRVVAEPPSPIETLSTYIGNAIGPLGTAGIVLVFVVFILLQREDLRDRIIRLIGEGRIYVTTEALDDAAKRISRYLMAQAMVNGTYGLAVALGLAVIGRSLGGDWFPSFVLWGLLCGLLRFIPYIGPWIGAAFPLAIAFAVYPGYAVFACVVGMFVIIELLSNNLMEPWLYGASTGLSTVAILVAAVFWTWLWGPIGLLLSTPLTVCIVVIGKYVPQFAFLDILLGDEPVLEPHQRLYQRLLAGDAEEATELAEQYLSTQPLETVYDTMILPALSIAEQDRHAGRVGESRGSFIRQSIRDLIDELIDEERAKEARHAADETLRLAREGIEQAPVAQPPDSQQAQVTEGPARTGLPRGCVIRVVILPAHDQADEVAGVMLAQLLELRGYCAVPISHNSLASEMLEQVQQQEAQIVCVSALPPAAVPHARYLCKLLHARFPQVHPVVGLWTSQADLKRVQHRMACAGDVSMATTLARGIETIAGLAQPLMGREIAAEQEPEPAPSDKLEIRNPDLETNAAHP